MSRRKSRLKGSSEAPSGAAGWMTTYSDLMSLLLTFFILLYSMSTIDLLKFESISGAIQQVLAGYGGTAIIEGQGNNEPIPVDQGSKDSFMESSQISQEIVDMYNKVATYVDGEGLGANVSVSMNKRGVFVDIKEAILFESGSAEIKGSGLGVLKILEGLVNNFTNNIVIEGHTDNVPIRSSIYPSNWELSTARAVSVVRYLSEVANVDPQRLSAVGYGEYQPIAPNDTSEHKAANRRVNILIIIDEESEEAVNGK